MTLTCSTLALQYISFTQFANQALAEAESGGDDQTMNKHWELLKRFEFNFYCW
ncbi:hypothetical protein BDR04DRAFT_1096820 [Suillus decipiens]|nr:hypothetical protein BDR04DRAFT_1096820 [Suillus decipiens]